MSERAPVSREQYELLLEEAQAVERERVRLEAELQASALERTRIETELEHVRSTAERHAGDAQARAAAQQRLEEELAAVREERAVTAARLESAGELKERVASLEEANNQLAFALRDSGQGFRQALLEAAPERAEGGSGTAPALWRRPGLWGAAAAGVAAIALVLVEGGRMRELVRARDVFAAEQRQSDREARAELATALESERANTRAWLESLRADQAALARAGDERAAQRERELRDMLERVTGAWELERSALAGALERVGQELGELREATRETAPLLDALRSQSTIADPAGANPRDADAASSTSSSPGSGADSVPESSKPESAPAESAPPGSGANPASDGDASLGDPSSSAQVQAPPPPEIALPDYGPPLPAATEP